MKVRRFQVIEDSIGGLHLAVFEQNGDFIAYFHSGYEQNPEQLINDIFALKCGACPEVEWDGHRSGLTYEYHTDPQVLYDEITSYEYGWNIIADNEGIYEERMGVTVRMIFICDNIVLQNIRR